MQIPGTAPACPRCGSAARAVKVSRLYLEATSWRADPAPEPPESLRVVLEAGTLAALAPGRFGRSRFLHDLARRLAPPSASSRTGLMIHPDMLIAGFSAIGAFALHRMAVSQPELLVPSGLTMAFGLAGYALLRGRVLAHFEAQRERDRLGGERVAGAVKLWMGLYYCGADGVVFDPASGWIHESGSLAEALLVENGADHRPPEGGSKLR